MDYPRIVKQPMDLGTVKVILSENDHLQKKLDNDEYHDIYAFADDVHLIWYNCFLYNPEGSEIRLVCQKISQKFEEKFKNMLSKRRKRATG